MNHSGIETTKHKVKVKMGIFGKVRTYFGVVESHNWGSLHLHLILWLEDALTSEDMQKLLWDAEFRACILAYIHANLRAHVPGLDSRVDVKKTANEVEIVYSWPIHPGSPNYNAHLANFEQCLVRFKQVHTCKLLQYFMPNKQGHYWCKWHAPYEGSLDNYIDESGKWKPKCIYEYLNSWNPAILLNGTIAF